MTKSYPAFHMAHLNVVGLNFQSKDFDVNTKIITWKTSAEKNVTAFEGSQVSHVHNHSCVYYNKSAISKFEFVALVNDRVLGLLIWLV